MDSARELARDTYNEALNRIAERAPAVAELKLNAARLFVENQELRQRWATVWRGSVMVAPEPKAKPDPEGSINIDHW